MATPNASLPFWLRMLSPGTDAAQVPTSPTPIALPGMPAAAIPGLGPYAKETGTSEAKNTNTNQTGSNTSTNDFEKKTTLTDPILQDPEAQRLRERAEALVAPYRALNQSAFTNSLKALTQDQGPDLSPLIGFVRGFKGQEHAGEGYQAPLSAASRMQQGIAELNKYTAGENTAEDNVRDFIKSGIIPRSILGTSGGSTTSSEFEKNTALQMQELKDALLKANFKPTGRTEQPKPPAKLPESAINKISDMERTEQALRSTANQIGANPNAFGASAVAKSLLPRMMEPADIQAMESTLADTNVAIKKAIDAQHITPAQGAMNLSLGGDPATQSNRLLQLADTLAKNRAAYIANQNRGNQPAANFTGTVKIGQNAPRPQTGGFSSADEARLAELEAKAKASGK